MDLYTLPRYSSFIMNLTNDYYENKTIILDLPCAGEYDKPWTNIKFDSRMIVNKAQLDLTKKNNVYLCISTIQKMVQRFLTEKKMPKDKLAEVLAIGINDLERVFSGEDLSRLIARINLPLIKLYCKTKWA